jgi:NAD(P)-dependent dehydrogenase (short-subunit alcohol dehydrogenase family)
LNVLAPDGDRCVSDAKRTAFVTGGSAGLGAAVCAGLAARGWTVIAASRRGVSSGASPLIRPIALDVTDPDEFETVVRGVLEEHAHLDAIVLNAGINTPAPIEELSLARTNAIMDTNFWGVVHGVRAVLGHFRRRRAGVITVVGSLAGIVTPPGEAIYAASKHALEGWLEGLQYEVGPFGIGVRLVEPGFIRTDLAAASQAHQGAIADYDSMRDHLTRQWGENLNKGMSSDYVAGRVVALTVAAKAPFRTRIGGEAVWVPRMKKILPESWFFAGTRRTFGLG